MLLGARIAVVVPAYNVDQWISDTIGGVPSFVDRILVVDDASTDATARATLGAGDARVELLRHARNEGVGAAIMTGYRRALAWGAEVAAVMAGDGQMDPDDLAGIVAPVARGEVDYVKGNRLAHPDARLVMPIPRRAGTAALAWLTRKAAGLASLSDSQCGYTAIGRSGIAALDGAGIWPRYGYPNDVIGALAERGHRIGEVMVRPVYRGEPSGLRAYHLLPIGFLIARIALRNHVLSAPRRRARDEALACA